MKEINKYFFDWIKAIKIFIFSLVVFFFIYIFIDNTLLFINILLSYIIVVGIILDSRIIFNRKIIIILLLSLLRIISVYIEEVPYLIIKDLFWYSLILNFSFIFHVLILSWIYRICWLNRWEFCCHIVSRISYLLSISFIVYILIKIITQIDFYVYKKEGIVVKILDLVYNLIYILIIILRYFIIVFHSYINIIMGIIEKNDEELIDKVIKIYKYVEYWILILSISIIIGYPRLYIIWIILIIKKIYEIVLEWRDEKGKKNNKGDLYGFIKDIFFLVPNNVLYKIEQEQVKVLIEIYEKPYYEFFTFDLLKFLLVSWRTEGTQDVPELILGEFPIKSVFNYYPWIYLLKQYYMNRELTLKYYCFERKKYEYFPLKERVEMLKEMTELINIDSSNYKLIDDSLKSKREIKLLLKK